jgi:hypothetical protein
MPTSVHEANKMYRIIIKYVDLETAQNLVEELNDEIGKPAKNMSLKVSLQMLFNLFHPPQKDCAGLHHDD